MKPINAILTTLLIVVVLIIIAGAIYYYTGNEKAAEGAARLFVLISAIGVAIESIRLKTKRYEGNTNAFWNFIGVLMIWPICFPLFLVARNKIVTGVAKIKVKK